MERREEILLKQLRKEMKLPKEYLQLERKVKKAEDDDDEYWIELMDMKDEILKPYFSWDNIKEDLETYYLSGSCHWANRTYGLALARLVEPTEKWRVLSGKQHTTIINKNNTKIFDLLYWGINGRLENHMFGDKIKKQDPTFGGKSAYGNALIDDNDDNDDNDCNN